MILSQAQAEAVYSAMAALNNVSLGNGLRVSFIGEIDNADFKGGETRFTVEEVDDALIRVTCAGGFLDKEREYYDNQAAFAAAYNLQ